MSDHVLEHLARDFKQLQLAYGRLVERVSALEGKSDPVAAVAAVEPVKRGPGRPKKATNENIAGN